MSKGAWGRIVLGAVLVVVGAVAGYIAGRGAGGPTAGRGTGSLTVVDAGFALPDPGAFTIRVRVLDPEGEPCSRVIVRAVADALPRGPDGALLVEEWVIPSAYTDEAGTALLRVPAAGRYAVEAVDCHLRPVPPAGIVWRTGVLTGSAGGVDVAAGAPREVEIRSATPLADLRDTPSAEIVVVQPVIGLGVEARVFPHPAEWTPPSQAWTPVGGSESRLPVPRPPALYGVEARPAAGPHASVAGASLRAEREAESRPCWRISWNLPPGAVERRRWVHATIDLRMADGGGAAGTSRLPLTLESSRGGRWTIPVEVVWEWDSETSARARWWVDPADGPWTLSWEGPGVESGSVEVRFPAAGQPETVRAEVRVERSGIEPALEGVEVVDERGRAVAAGEVVLWHRVDGSGTRWEEVCLRLPYAGRVAGEEVTPVARDWRIGAPARLPRRGRARLEVALGGYVLLHLRREPPSGLVWGAGDASPDGSDDGFHLMEVGSPTGVLTAERADGGWLGYCEPSPGPPDGPPQGDLYACGTVRAGSLLGPLPPGPVALRFRLGGVEIGTATVPVRAGEIVVLSIR